MLRAQGVDIGVLVSLDNVGPQAYIPEPDRQVDDGDSDGR